MAMLQLVIKVQAKTQGSTGCIQCVFWDGLPMKNLSGFNFFLNFFEHMP